MLTLLCSLFFRTFLLLHYVTVITQVFNVFRMVRLDLSDMYVTFCNEKLLKFYHFIWSVYFERNVMKK